jgi:thioredoxin 1
MENNFYTIINTEKPVLIDFYATWCGPCKMLAPVLKQVKEELGDTIKIIKIDTDKNQDLSARYQIKGVPTMILFQNGKQLWRQSGLLTKEQIIDTIINKSIMTFSQNKKNL